MLTGLVFLAALLAANDTSSQCRILVSAKQAGEAVYADEIAAAACPERQPAPVLRYDPRRRLVVARADLASGTELGRAFVPRRPAVAAGDRILLTVAVGHVTISRGAQALQTAREGEPFFARTEDGQVIVAPAITSFKEPGILP